MSSPAPLNVCITGAAGQISYSLLPLLSSGHVFGPDQPLNLHLLEIPPALPALSGVVMEIIDGAYPLVKSVIQTSDPKVAFRGAHIAILVGAFPRRAGMERKDLLAKNLPIFKAQGHALNEVANRDVKVVVVGNPANTNAMVLSHFAPQIPPTNITALTRLDHNRALAQVAKRMDVSVLDVHDVCIWGNHSSTQYPDVTRATADGKQVLPKMGGFGGLAEGFIPLIQKRGATIIQARGMSSAMSAANAISDHLRSWILGDSQVVSMAVPADGSYGINKGVYFSYPVRCVGGGSYEIVQGIELDEFSRKYVEATAAELYAERAEALALFE
uniref:Malate dehydrogenase n=1 Tax=Betaphycus philippinensis TaxID=88415 RepID=A0A097IUM3_9FLOR|nr:malate dehydrogenase [Betaphycus philippinensis]